MKHHILCLLSLLLLLSLAACTNPPGSGTTETTDEAVEKMTEDSDFPYPITDAELLKQVKVGMTYGDAMALGLDMGLCYSSGSGSPVHYYGSDGNKYSFILENAVVDMESLESTSIDDLLHSEAPDLSDPYKRPYSWCTIIDIQVTSYKK
ncbi:MAG: hypothetical protein E7618_00320 [Ruminococcaceae bacterium]|nr:hypothetical protein [Oscillospiraceae bacterium]